MTATERLRSRVLIPALLVGLSSCGSCARSQRVVHWPASPDVLLADELVATALAAHAPAPLLESGELDDRQVLPDDSRGVRAHSFVHAGLWVAEVVLGEVEPDTPLPLVVMLHGRGDRPRVPGGPFARVPTPMRVLLPRGPLRLGSGYAWARSSVTQNRHDELAADLLVAARQLAEVIAHVRATHPTVGTPVIAGFSQGAMLAWTLGLHYPQQAGLVLPIGGWVPPAARPDPLRAPPTRAMHGAADEIVRIEPTREFVELLRAAGNEIEWVEHAEVGHVVTAAMNQTFEGWLELALRERAPALTGGLGDPGTDAAPMELYEQVVDLDPTIDAVPAPIADPQPLGRGDAGLDPLIAPDGGAPRSPELQ